MKFSIYGNEDFKKEVRDILQKEPWDEKWIEVPFTKDSHGDVILFLVSRQEKMNIFKRRHKLYSEKIPDSSLSYTVRCKPIIILFDQDNWDKQEWFGKVTQEQYRNYLVNHEVGHALGRDHLPIDHHPTLVPVMYQLTKGIDGIDDRKLTFAPNEADYSPSTLDQ
jgi:hypothetical protein